MAIIPHGIPELLQACSHGHRQFLLLSWFAESTEHPISYLSWPCHDRLCGFCHCRFTVSLVTALRFWLIIGGDVASAPRLMNLPAIRWSEWQRTRGNAIKLLLMPSKATSVSLRACKTHHVASYHGLRPLGSPGWTSAGH